mgnify:CR=1 FL=1
MKIADVELKGEALLHIDATPDKEYPIRILKAHRFYCDMRWHADPPSAFCDEINRLQDERAKILDRAIAVLERHNEVE